MDMFQSFQASLFENCADDETRLVAADWLEEQGDLERAEFIRTQILLNPCPSALYDRPWEVPNARELMRREFALLRKHRAAWLAGELPHALMQTKGLEIDFRRGFADCLNFRLQAGFQHLPSAGIFRLDLPSGVQSSSASEGDIPGTLGAAFQLNARASNVQRALDGLQARKKPFQARSVDLDENWLSVLGALSDAAVAPWLTTAKLRRRPEQLEGASLDEFHTFVKRLTAFQVNLIYLRNEIDRLPVEGLEELDVYFDTWDDVLRLISRATRLKTLIMAPGYRLQDQIIPPSAVRAIMQLPNLERLRFICGRMGPPTAEALAGASRFGDLTHLEVVVDSRHATETIENLMGPERSSLRSLNLGIASVVVAGRTSITIDESTTAVFSPTTLEKFRLAAKKLSGLRRLELSGRSGDIIRVALELPELSALQVNLSRSERQEDVVTSFVQAGGELSGQLAVLEFYPTPIFSPALQESYPMTKIR